MWWSWKNIAIYVFLSDQNTIFHNDGFLGQGVHLFFNSLKTWERVILWKAGFAALILSRRGAKKYWIYHVDYYINR